MSPTRWKLVLQLVILLLVAVAVTKSMWEVPALLAGHSARKDLVRLVEFDAAFRGGDFFPSWSPDLYSGYGSPIFQFYAPLSYYAAEVPVLIGFDYATALKLTQLLALFLSGLAMYRLASTDFSGWVACVGAIFYMVAPYRLVDMFIRHALAEHCAFIWLPLIVWGTERFVSKFSRIGLVIGALATAALIFTHNIMALIAIPVCIVAGWAFASPKRGILSLAAAGAVATIGIGLAAIFWWPAIIGRAFTRAEESLTGGYYDFHRHFIGGWQFLDTHWNFGISGGGDSHQMPLQIGLLHLFAGLGALTMVLGSWQGEGAAGRRRAIWSVVGACLMAIGALMCCRWSQVLWESLPLLNYVQFPWRFLALVVFGGTICATALADRVAVMGERSAIITCLLGIVLLLAMYFPYYSQAYFFVGDARTRSIAKLSAVGVRDLQANGVAIPFGLSLSTAELRAMNERATSGDDFLPNQVKEKPTRPAGETVRVDGGRVLESAQRHQNHYRSRLQMSVPGRAELLQFWFPGWKATVDGFPVATAPAGPQAIVSCEVPAGDHMVEFSYRGLPQRRTAMIISILSAALAGCIILFHRRLQWPAIYAPTSSLRHQDSQGQ
jgi:6-pyruvoyl-tetrahydropterin synthase related domain